MDWAQLMAKTDEKTLVSNPFKKRWSFAAILKRVGISRSLLPELEYKRFLDKANEDIMGVSVFATRDVVEVLINLSFGKF